MRIELACFSPRGLALGRRLREALAPGGNEVGLTRCGAGGEALADWTRRNFAAARALVFIGAAGIAVRAVAPFLRSKLDDPAVLAVDDAGRFVIPLLSGHFGGANDLARRLARELGAAAAITTATDANGIFALDQWAARRGYPVRNPAGFKNASARLLAGEAVGLACAFPLAGRLPPGHLPAGEGDCHLRIALTLPIRPEPGQVVPPAAVLGLGCRKGTPAGDIRAAFERLCRGAGICPEAVGGVCSLDLKRDEPGVREFAEGLGLPFTTFTPAELAGVEGEYAGSAFVRKVAGVDNVCERAAALGAGGGRPLAGKTVFPGLTLALAERELRLDFREAGEDRPWD
ncbi:MAG: cobalamin biosynthesis protein [Planctomycetota bacterium]|jgi:cobalt-precorrin 5A hydrolase|nr:cobalamin biosynthesis protein [Planctomycetota bacterium]